MKRASVRDLRYDFKTVEAELAQGNPIEIVKRGKVIGKLFPAEQQEPFVMPDFEAQMKELFGDRIFEPSNAEVISWARGDR